MHTVTLEKAQTSLADILVRLEPGEEVTITVNGEPFAQVTKIVRTSWPSEPGTAAHREFWMAPDFNAPLDEYGEDAE